MQGMTSKQEREVMVSNEKKEAFLEFLVETDMLCFGDFKLKDGGHPHT